MKKCNKCSEEKPLTEFHKNKTTKDGKERKCKSCFKKQSEKYYKNNSELILEQNKTYRKNNTKKISQYQKIWYSDNKDQHLKISKQWRLDNNEKMKLLNKCYYLNHTGEHRERMKKWKEINPLYDVEYFQDNKENIYHQKRERYNNNPQYKLKKLLRGRIYSSVKSKSNSSQELLGCDIETYYNYLEKQFTKDMTWDNHGKVWEIDHTIPLNTFDLEDEGEQFKAFNYMNTRPLPITENRSRPKDGSDLV
ncbi:hypothetical protein OAD97_00285 [bacterium]|nr:hypothetical protein [bacterium]